MTEIIFTVIAFACLGITTSMQIEKTVNWADKKMYPDSPDWFITGKRSFARFIPTIIRCNKCLAFWGALTYSLFNYSPFEAIGIAAMAAVLSMIIYNKL